MTPNVQYIPAAVSGFTDLFSGTTTSDVSSNYYVTHTNIVGTSIFDGRGLTYAFYFQNTLDSIQFYFNNDTDRSTALAAYQTWRVVGTDGTSETLTPIVMSASRIRFELSTSFSASTTYTIQGQ